jgi:hypothetical protein
MMLKSGYFEKYFRNTSEVLKCGDEEGWKISFGPNV